MTEERFKEIRKEKDFLFQYYKEEGGTCPKASFDGALAAWIMTMGIHPTQGLAQIVTYLDGKFVKPNKEN